MTPEFSAAIPMFSSFSPDISIEPSIYPGDPGVPVCLFSTIEFAPLLTSPLNLYCPVLVSVAWFIIFVTFVLRAAVSLASPMTFSPVDVSPFATVISFLISIPYLSVLIRVLFLASSPNVNFPIVPNVPAPMSSSSKIMEFVLIPGSFLFLRNPTVSSPFTVMLIPLKFPIGLTFVLSFRFFATDIPTLFFPLTVISLLEPPEVTVRYLK